MQIVELHLFTDNLSATVSFYRDTLEVPLISQEKTNVSFQVGASILCFHASFNKQPVYHFAFTIPANKIDQAYQWAKEKTMLIDAAQGEKIADFTNWNSKAFYFVDNNKNIVEFIARFDLQNESFLPFSGSSFVAISEIGIVSDDVIKTCNEMIGEYGLSFFSKQPPVTNFAAIGDDNGLFIVVSKNRNWFPTDISSKESSFKIMFKSTNESDLQTLER